MDIVLIGSGNTATVLGRKAREAGHRIVQVFSPQIAHAADLALRLGADPVDQLKDIERNAGLMLIAIRDEAIRPFASALGTVNCMVAHTSGATPLDALKEVGLKYGVLYPLQSLRREIEKLPDLILLTDGSNEQVKIRLDNFARTIADPIIESNDEARLKYHLAAVVVNNFTNHLFALAAEFCEREAISFELLQPLIEETAYRLRTAEPAAAQTGPAKRGDLFTIQRHLKLTEHYPALHRFYELFTEDIRRFYLAGGEL